MKFSPSVRRATISVLAGMAATGLIMSLSACGGGQSAGSNKTTITFLSWDNEEKFRPFLDAFEKENPDITVDFSYSPPTNEYVSTLQMRLVGNQAPDVFVMTTENKKDVIDNGYALDITNEEFMKDIAQANKDFLSKDGKTYGMSVSGWEVGIAYNKDLLPQVGADTIPETWDEFISLCKKLKDAGITPYYEEPSGFATVNGFLGAMYAQNPDLKNGDTIATGEHTFSEEWNPAVEQWARLWTEGVVSQDVVALTGDDIKSQFISGQVAMYQAGPWDLGDLDESGINYGFDLYPAMKEGLERYGAGNSSPGYVIYSKTEGKKLEAAKKFLEFLKSDTALKMMEANGDLITVQSFNATPSEKLKSVYENGIKPGKYYQAQSHVPDANAFSNTIAPLVQEVAQGKITPKDLTKQLDEKLPTWK